MTRDFILFSAVYIMLMCYNVLHENIKKPFEHLLITFAFLVVSYVLIRLLLGCFGLQFRAWINDIWLAITGFSFIIGLFQTYTDTKRTFVKIGIALFFALGIIFLILYPFAPWALVSTIDEIVPLRDEVVEMDGYKLVDYKHFALFDRDARFYDYKNFFVAGCKCRFAGLGYATDEDGNIYLYDDLKMIDDINEILD